MKIKLLKGLVCLTSISVATLITFPKVAKSSETTRYHEDLVERLPSGMFVPPMSYDHMNAIAPEDSNSLFEQGKCSTAGAKSVQNYNVYLKAVKLPSGDRFSVIGEKVFVKFSSCYRNVNEPSEIVVTMVLGTKRQVEYDKRKGIRTGGQTVITVFDKDLNVVRWSYG